MNRRHLLAGIVGVGLAPRALAKTNLSGGDEAQVKRRLQQIVDSYVRSGRLSGATASLNIGSCHVNVTAGRVAIGQTPLFDQDSICRVYSMTKPVTGCAAMLLIEDGKLDLDQPVEQIIPELRKLTVAVDAANGLDARPATRSLTVRHLLTHSGGLAYWTPEAGTDALSKAYRLSGITPGNFYKSGLARPGYGRQVDSLGEMVKRLADLPLASEPGTAWRYSVGLDVMGLVIERVSGQSLDAFTRERFFVPLGMESTGFHVAPSARAQLTTNYTVTPAGLAPLDLRETSVFLQPPKLLAGGAGLLSTARDFMRFGAMLLDDGKFGRARVMKSQTARLARSNLLPNGVAYAGGGFGAGMRVAAGGATPRDAVGALSWNGAAGTMWLVNPAQRMNFVFFSQFMPPTSYPIWDEVMSALH